MARPDRIAADLVQRESAAPSPPAEPDLTIEVEHALADRPSLSISLRIVLSMLLCFLMVTSVVVASMTMISRVSTSQRVLEKASSYALEIEHARRCEKNFLLYGTNLEEAMARTEAAHQVLRSTRHDLAEVVGERGVDAMEESLESYRALLERLAAPSGAPESSENRGAIERDLRRRGAEVVAEAADLIDRERLQMHAVIRMSWVVAGASLLFILIGMGLMSYLLTLQVARPLRRFVEYTQRIADGDYSPIRPARRYRDEFSRLAIATNRMLVRLKDRETQLTRSSRMAAVGTLTAGIAHELNNPLNNIGLNAEALLGGLDSFAEAQKRKMLTDIGNQVERASSTVRNLLDFTRVEKPIVKRLKLTDPIEQARRLSAHEAEINNVSFDLSVPDGLPRVEGNARDLQQVFINLFVNAVQAMPNGGTLRVRAALDADRMVRVEVSDSGVGIPVEHLGSVFDPFFTTKEGGTGLGLSVTYGIVERHRGTLHVASTVGAGTTFTLRLPVASSEVARYEREG